MSQFPRPGATVTVNGKKYAIRDVEFSADYDYNGRGLILTTFVRTEPAPEMIEITIVATPHDIERLYPLMVGTALARRIIEAHTDDQDEADRAVRLFGTYALPGPYATYEDHARDALRALDAVRHARP